MKKKRSLSLAGLVLFALPLFCQLSFLALIDYQLLLAKASVKHQLEAEECSKRINKLIIDLLEYMFFVKFQAFSPGLDSTLQELSLPSELSGRISNILSLPVLSEAKRRQLEEARKIASPVRQNARGQTNNIAEQSVHLFDILLGAAREVNSERNQIEFNNLASSARLRNYLLVGWLCLTLSLVAMTLLIFRLVYRPLSIILENARRLGLGEALNLPVKAAAEIEAIDGCLHQISSELTAAYAEQKQLYELSPALICRVDAGGRMLMANQSALRWLQINPQSSRLDKIVFFTLFDDIVRLRLETVFERARDEQTKMTTKLTLVNHRAMPLHTSWTVNWSEQHQSYFTLAMDVTDATNMALVREQMGAYLNTELGAPLAVVKEASASLSLLDGPGAAENKHVLSIKNNVERLTILLNQLNQADSDSAEGGVDFDFCINQAVISDSVDAVRNLALKKQINIVAQPEFAMVACNRWELERVIINLLSNAIKFTPENGTIKVESRLLKTVVSFSISDSGAGIPPKALATIFAAYQQADNQLQNVVPSTGLGLSVCKTIIERHGGTIRAENAESGGAVILFQLPAFAEGR
ncbi:MAG: sensor histidine kinase [Candidatus Melainabacteria bacterium]|nr:sensor histidine kinase [Candidatus Melainabacteria bacterium]